jgi:hypothetical protein
VRELSPTLFSTLDAAVEACGHHGVVSRTQQIRVSPRHSFWFDEDEPGRPALMWQGAGVPSRVHRTRGKVNAVAGVSLGADAALAWCTALDEGRAAFGLVRVDPAGNRVGRAQLGGERIRPDEPTCSVALTAHGDSLWVALRGDWRSRIGKATMGTGLIVTPTCQIRDPNRDRGRSNASSRITAHDTGAGWDQEN